MMKAKKTWLKFIVVVAICFVTHILVGLFSSLMVNNFVLNTRLANFTIYDGYADFSILLFYIPLSALLIFNKIKGNGFLISLGAFFIFLMGKVFIVDVISHYLRLYVKTQQNGAYSFEIFKDQLAKNWGDLLWEFSHLGQFLSFMVWVFIALLGVCYLSLWIKNKLKMNIKIHPIFGLFLLFGFSSCGDNIQREKDKYPDIPEFPLFKQNALAYKKLGLATVSYKDNQSAKVDGHDLVIHTNDYFFYAVADSCLLLITGYREAIKPGNEFPAKHFITLTRVKNHKIDKYQLTDTTNVANLNCVIVAKQLQVGNKAIDLSASKFMLDRKISTAKKSTDSTFFSSWNFVDKPTDFESKDIFDSTFVKEFDRVTVGSKGHLSGGLNNGIDYTYDRVPLVYYQFNVGSKIALTKINFDEQKPPLLLKIKDNIYCITYSNELKLRQEIKHYEIGVIE
ncbi:hypothetical protein [Pedobacter sp. SL55]|uniref:hypothetical protein n=1 Tax=Pedobacter sp. SL55 TaxID=2995161 RepID=UPI00226F8BDE|nr:hypothetical protein [Pedobacter sp. SL55]WAC42549.1 hypothetical protein OVA16_09405 [Pedobacter sp. SL55]